MPASLCSPGMSAEGCRPGGIPGARQVFQPFVNGPVARGKFPACLQIKAVFGPEIENHLAGIHSDDQVVQPYFGPSRKRISGEDSAERRAESLSNGIFHTKENTAVPRRNMGTARMAQHLLNVFFTCMPSVFRWRTASQHGMEGCVLSIRK